MKMSRQRLQRSPGKTLGAAARELPLDGALLGRLYRNFTETVREVQGFVMRTSGRCRRRSSGSLGLCARVRPSEALGAWQVLIGTAGGILRVKR